MGAGRCQLVFGHFPPITVLEKEFTIQTLAAMALAVYTIIEHRSKACTTEVKS